MSGCRRTHVCHPITSLFIIIYFSSVFPCMLNYVAYQIYLISLILYIFFFTGRTYLYYLFSLNSYLFLVQLKNVGRDKGKIALLFLAVPQLKLNYCKKVFFFLIHLFARETKPTFIKSFLKVEY